MKRCGRGEREGEGERADEVRRKKDGTSSALNGVYTYLTVEDVVWCVLLELEVPDESDSVWVMGDVLVSEVGDEQELWVLGRVCVCGWEGGGGGCGELVKHK